MDYLPRATHLFRTPSSDVLWWSVLLVPPLFLIFHTLNISILLYLVGLVASAAFGSLSWIAFRLHASPKYKVNENYIGLPRIVTEFQRSNIEEIINSRLDSSCHLEECHEDHQDSESAECALSNGIPVVSRSIDQELNDVVDSIFKYYIGSWMEDLLYNDEESGSENTDGNGMTTSGSPHGNKIYSNASLDELHKICRHDSWFVIRNLYERLKEIDWVKFLACDVVKKVTEHLEKIRIVSTSGSSGNASVGNANVDPLGRIFSSNNDQSPEPPVFHVQPFLLDHQKEIQYLSKISELAILFLTPVSYSACHITRRFLKEILSKQILFKTIEMITDPDYINQKLLLLIHKIRHDQKDRGKETFSVDGKAMGLSGNDLDEVIPQPKISSPSKPLLGRFDSGESDAGTTSETFQSFLTQINDSEDVEQIKRIHFNILTEIVQATTLCNVQEAKGVGSIESIDKTGQGFSQKDREHWLDEQKRLQRYIGQLVHAKSLCDNRLRYLEKRKRSLEENGKEPFGNDNQEADMSNPMMAEHHISLAFDAIMNSPFSRRYFYSYLEKFGKEVNLGEKHNKDQRAFTKLGTPPYQDLLGFWAAVEELKNSDKKVWHQLATEIFYTYINKPQDPWKIIKITRGDLKRIENFLVGDSGPDVFYRIQADVLKTLEQEHYPAFLVSETCYKMLEDAQDNGITLSERRQSSVKPKSRATSIVDLVTTRTFDNNLRNDERSSFDVSRDTLGLWTETTCNEEKPFANNYSGISGQTAESLLVDDHTNFAKSHLEHIGERLLNKTQALKALKSSLKPESKVNFLM